MVKAAAPKTPAPRKKPPTVRKSSPKTLDLEIKASLTGTQRVAVDSLMFLTKSLIRLSHLPMNLAVRIIMSSAKVELQKK